MSTMLHRTLAVAACTLATGLAQGQLTPDKEFYGVRRPVAMTVTVPAGMDAESASIALFRAGTTEALVSVPVSPGRVDLAALYPSLWDRTEQPVLYAQLVVGEARVGPAVVIVALNNPRLADASTGQLRWQNTGSMYSGVRAYVEKDVVFETTQGDIRIRMRPDHAPNTVRHIMGLVAGGFYEDIIFHRIVPVTGAQNHPFVIQAGDPAGMGVGGPGVFTDLEPSTLPHDFGVISMARTQNPNTNGSQFFLCLSRPGTAFLDGQYCAFGETIEGGSVIRAIAAVPIDANDRPVGDPPTIVRARLVDSAPYGTGPKPVSQAPTEPVAR